MISKIAIAFVFASLLGCANASHNLMATLCGNGQTILTEIPTGFLSPAQVADAQSVACSTFFGTVPAPAPAPGNKPVALPLAR